MLKKTTNKRVESSAGFSVEVPDTHHVRYEQGSKKSLVEIEGGEKSNAVHWLVYSDILRGWLPPDDDTPLSAQERDKILRRISQGLDVLGMKHTVV